MFERALASICLFHKVLRCCVARGPRSLRLHTCTSIRGDYRVPFTTDSVIEFRTGGGNVDRMKNCVCPGRVAGPVFEARSFGDKVTRVTRIFLSSPAFVMILRLV